MTQEQIDQWIKENQTYNAQELDRGPVIPVGKVREFLQVTPPAAVNQQLLEALELCFEHCKLYHREVVDNNVGVACRAAILAAAAGGAK